MLLSREIIAPATANDYEVQQLRFRLPTGAAAMGPTAHVKVRAPDVEGQQNRVRAYSIIIDDGSFNLTVKIYPGGPPRTRGLSAYLGVLHVGALIHVPHTRTIPWLLTPSGFSTAHVGLIAFGVGIAEVIEPAQLLLTGGATVSLVYASRARSSILYRERTCRLLRAHPETFRVRHCLSRPGDARKDAADIACAPNERITAGRIDASVVAEEFGGSWADHRTGDKGSSSIGIARRSDHGNVVHFMVVGTTQMEQAAWGLIYAAFGSERARPLLGRGGRWRNLMPEPLRSCPALQ